MSSVKVNSHVSTVSVLGKTNTSAVIIESNSNKAILLSQNGPIIIPTGYLTDMSLFLQKGETGLFYPKDNPSGYINKIQDAYDLDINTGTLNNNDILAYAESEQKWLNVQMPASGEQSPYDLKTNNGVITGIQYLDGRTTQIIRSGEYITSIDYGDYQKILLYSGNSIVGVRFS